MLEAFAPLGKLSSMPSPGRVSSYLVHSSMYIAHFVSFIRHICFQPDQFFLNWEAASLPREVHRNPRAGVELRGLGRVWVQWKYSLQEELHLIIRVVTM